MSDRFTGGDALTEKNGLKYYIHKTMMLNELAGGSGAYEISNAKLASSGPSFGGIQYDLGSNEHGRTLFESIANAATNAKGEKIISDAELKQIQDHLYKSFGNMSATDKVIYSQLKPKMDQVLASDEGKSQVNADYNKALDRKVAHVNSVVDGITNPENKAYLKGDLKSQVMISDISNQYGSSVNNKLTEFLNQTSKDAGVQLPKGLLVKVSGELDSADISSFRMATNYGVNNPKDAERRDRNINDVVGSNKLSVAPSEKASAREIFDNLYASLKSGNSTAFASAITTAANSDIGMQFRVDTVTMVDNKEHAQTMAHAQALEVSKAPEVSVQRSGPSR